MIYTEPLYRPPSEANSLIIQLTNGCSFNQCKFCPMYKGKKFYIKSPEELNQHLNDLEMYIPSDSKRAFLADGDALSMDTERLMESLTAIRHKFPSINRFGVYGSVYSLYKKSRSDLEKLRDLGLRFVYLGIESGDPATLKKISKYTPIEDMIANCRKVIDAGINLSVMVIIGLAGRKNSMVHIQKSAQVVNQITPTYTSLLNFMYEHTPFNNDPDYTNFNVEDYLCEVSEFIRYVECKTIFRSNHASNYISLKGVLPRDKEKLLHLLSC